jgi:transcriptional regulator with XRE-family HTH domain
VVAVSENLLGDFLRARRGLIRPESVGVSVRGTRRVPGLRREEVAMLAGISIDYYLRLEQGRDRNPSVHVLESLARVLQLDQAATDYLLALAGPRPRRRRRPRRETVPVGARQLLDIIGLPAFIEGRYFDVLAANDLANALSPNLQPGRNRMRDLFLDPAERALFLEWEWVTAAMVAHFRQSVGSDPDDPRFVQLVGELSVASERFRRLWGRQDVKAREGIPVPFHHPQVGDLTFRCEKLAIGGTEGQVLAVIHPEPGTSSAEKLLLLSTLTGGVAAEPGGRPVETP